MPFITDPGTLILSLVIGIPAGSALLITICIIMRNKIARLKSAKISQPRRKSSTRNQTKPAEFQNMAFDGTSWYNIDD